MRSGCSACRLTSEGGPQVNGDRDVGLGSHHHGDSRASERRLGLLQEDGPAIVSRDICCLFCVFLAARLVVFTNYIGPRWTMLPAVFCTVRERTQTEAGRGSMASYSHTRAPGVTFLHSALDNYLLRTLHRALPVQGLLQRHFLIARPAENPFRLETLL